MMLSTPSSLLSAFLLLVVSLLSAAHSNAGVESLHRRQDDKCFATEFGIHDFKTFSGGMNQPAYVSFKVASTISSDRALCSYRSPSNGPTLFFKQAVACKGTTKSDFKFTYEEGKILTITETTSCGQNTAGYVERALGVLRRLFRNQY